MIEMIVELDKPAQRSGGDRYKAAPGSTFFGRFTIYLPQEISRDRTDAIHPKFSITIERYEDE